MIVWVMVAVLGWSVLATLSDLYSVGWAIWYLGRRPFDLLLALMAMATGVWVCHTYLGW